MTGTGHYTGYNKTRLFKVRVGNSGARPRLYNDGQLDPATRVETRVDLNAVGARLRRAPLAGPYIRSPFIFISHPPTHPPTRPPGIFATCGSAAAQDIRPKPLGTIYPLCSRTPCPTRHRPFTDKPNFSTRTYRSVFLSVPRVFPIRAPGTG